MRLSFSGDIADVEDGLAAVAPMLGIELTSDGLPVAAVRADDNGIQISKRKSDGGPLSQYPREVPVLPRAGTSLERPSRGRRL